MSNSTEYSDHQARFLLHFCRSKVHICFMQAQGNVSRWWNRDSPPAGSLVWPQVIGSRSENKDVLWAATGSGVGAGSAKPPEAPQASGASTFTLLNSGGTNNDRALAGVAFTVVPEPSTTALLLGALCAVVLLRRRRF